MNDDEWVEQQTASQGKTHGTERRRTRHPKGMEPGIRLDAKTGRGHVVAVVKPGQDPAWEEILQRLGFGGVCHVLEVIEVRAWQVYSNEHGLQTLNYVKARVKDKSVVDDRVDIELLCKQVMKWKIKKPRKRKAGSKPVALVILLSDWQIGKSAGDGVSGTVHRVRELVGWLTSRLQELRAQGLKIDRLVFASMGDMVEGCDGHYPMQTFSVELDRRQQCKVTRRLILKLVAGLAHLVREIVFVAVPGNHGENRKNGKAFTTWGDNDDLAVVDQVAEICAGNKSLSHVSFVIPKDDLTVTLDIYGVPVAFAHGHQARSGSPEKKLLDWWKNMGFSEHPVGDCKILFTGHYHHLKARQCGKKSWFQCPALDGGSPWWEHRGGEASPAGTLTVVVGDSLPWGWDYMKVAM